MLSVLHTILIIIVLIVYCTVVGRVLLCALLPTKALPATYAYYMGLMVTLLLFTISALYITSITYTMYILGAVGLVGMLYLIKCTINPLKISLKLLGISILIAIAVYAILQLIYYTPTGISTVQWPHYGSIHTGRSMAITGYYNEHDKLTVIGQNIGQNIISLIYLRLGCTQLALATSITIAVQATIFILLLFHFLLSVFKNKKAVMYTILIICLGSTSVGLVPNNIIDIGYPIVLGGYSDNYIALAALGSILYTVYLITYSTYKKISLCYILIIGMLASIISGIQNIVVILPLVVAYTLWYVKIKDYKNLKKVVHILLILVSGFAIAKYSIGMLVKPSMIDVAIPESIIPKQTGIKIVPAVSHKYYLEQKYTFKQVSVIPNIDSILPQLGITNKVRAAAYVLQVNVWEALRLYFFPILLMILSIVLWYNKRTTQLHNYILACSIIFFMVGFGISFFIQYNGFKNELNRFMYPFIVLAIIQFGFLVKLFTATISTFFLYFIFAVSLLPTVIELVLRIVEL